LPPLAALLSRAEFSSVNPALQVVRRNEVWMPPRASVEALPPARVQTAAPTSTAG
jgi:hypothetical protein